MPDVLPFETVEGTINSLKSATGMVHDQLAYVRQYRTTHSGGGGLFRWDSISTEMPNGGTIIDLNSGGTGRWKRDQVKDALDFGADPTYDLGNLGTDTTPKSTDTLYQYLSWARDNKQTVLIPKGVYYIDQLNKDTGAGSLSAFFKITNPTVAGAASRTAIRGAGIQQTILAIDPAASGDVFQIEECWRVSGLADALHYAPNAETPNQTANQGVTIQDLSIVSKASLVGSTVQNPAIRGIVTVGRVDELRLFNLQFSWLKTALSLGMETLTVLVGGEEEARAHLRESSFSNLHVLHCGTTEASAMDIGSGAVTVHIDELGNADGGDGSNHLFFDQCSVVYPEGIGLNIENRGLITPTEIQSVKVRRIRFTNLMLYGSSPKVSTALPAAPVMRVKGLVDDLTLIGVSLNGSTLVSSTDYGCIEFAKFDDNNFPVNVKLYGDLRACSGIGLDVKRCNALHAELTVDQASLGTGTKRAVQFSDKSIGDNQTALVRAISGYAGSPPGTNVFVETSVQESVVAERSSGGITGLHMQRRGTQEPTTLKFCDDTLLVNPTVTKTVTLPLLAETQPGKRLYVMDRIGQAHNNPITITVADALVESIEGFSSVMLDTRWGKRGFQAVEVGVTMRWLTWQL
jgi:hypothetical protein